MNYDPLEILKKYADELQMSLPQDYDIYEILENIKGKNMKEVYILKCDSDGTMRSIPEPFGVAVTNEEDAKRFATDFKNYGYKQSYEKIKIYETLEEALKLNK